MKNLYIIQSVFKILSSLVITLALMTPVTGIAQETNSVQSTEPLSEAITENSSENTITTDVVILIDNSSDMLKSDSKKEIPTTFSDFSGEHEESMRLGLVAIGDKTKLVAALADYSADGFNTSLSNINYDQTLRNMPAGIERAIYELKLNSSANKSRAIILITNGSTHTGDKDKDAEQISWMRSALVADAQKNSIHIYGIALSENADLPLIQSLAQQTDAEYYRADSSTDIPAVLALISRNINETIKAKAVAERTQPEKPPVEEKPADPSPPAPAPPVAPPAPAADNTIQYLLYGIAALLVIIILVVLLRGRSANPATNAASDTNAIPNAKLVDTFRVTGKSDYPITTPITQIGRVAGNPIPDVSYIVIGEKRISRHHAVIEYRNLAFWVMDQGSGNGTKLNGSLLTEERRLKHGDVLLFDSFEFAFHEAGMEHADATMIQVSENQGDASAEMDFEIIDDQDDSLPESEPASPSPMKNAADAVTVEDLDPFLDMEFESDDEANSEATTESVSEEPRIVETEDGGFEPNQTMTPDEFDKLFAEIDENKKK